MKRVLAVWVVAASMACSGGQVETRVDSTAASVSLSEQWRELSARRVFFGHQSVGMDILAGVKDLQAQGASGELRVASTSDAGQLAPGTLAHAAVGTNGDPWSKIRSFKAFMDGGIGNTADIALFKFCYIDVDASTDVDRLFTDYQSVMSELKRQYPATRIVHVTMPLRMVQSGPKAVVKKLLGKPLGGYAENIRRNVYNEKLRSAYSGREPLFDLAHVESARLDGSRITFDAEGQQFAALNPQFTYDNGHLNEDGRVRAAREFVRVLAEAR